MGIILKATHLFQYIPVHANILRGVAQIYLKGQVGLVRLLLSASLQSD